MSERPDSANIPVQIEQRAVQDGWLTFATENHLLTPADQDFNLTEANSQFLERKQAIVVRS